MELINRGNTSILKKKNNVFFFIVDRIFPGN